MELITFILCAYGLTQILVYSKVLEKIRPTKGKLGELANCPMCMGFHVGWFLMLLSPFTELFSFDVSITNFFLLAWLSSGTQPKATLPAVSFRKSWNSCWLCWKKLLDNNLKENNDEYALDTKMDAAARKTLL